MRTMIFLFLVQVALMTFAYILCAIGGCWLGSLGYAIALMWMSVAYMAKRPEDAS